MHGIFIGFRARYEIELRMYAIGVHSADLSGARYEIYFTDRDVTFCDRTKTKTRTADIHSETLGCLLRGGLRVIASICIPLDNNHPVMGNEALRHEPLPCLASMNAAFNAGKTENMAELHHWTVTSLNGTLVVVETQPHQMPAPSVLRSFRRPLILGDNK